MTSKDTVDNLTEEKRVDWYLLVELFFSKMVEHVCPRANGEHYFLRRIIVVV